LPGLNLWDLSLRKQFILKENMKLRFEANMFNFLNHANFRDPDTSPSSSSYGACSTAGPSRNIQFGLKLNF